MTTSKRAVDGKDNARLLPDYFLFLAFIPENTQFGLASSLIRACVPVSIA